MNYSNSKVVMAMVLIASLFALAGCGGGGSTPATTLPDPTPPPPDFNSQLLMHHQAAVDATAMAEGAGMAAAQAGQDATKYSKMLGIEQVNGDSTVAMMNAQKILDAQDTVDKALMDAEKAKMDAMDAKTAAAAIPDGTDGKVLAIEALDAAIKVADDEIKAVTAIRDGRPLDDAVFAVEGANMKGTPRSIADAVGQHLLTALIPTPSSNPVTAELSNYVRNNSNTSQLSGALATATLVEMDDSQGSMTWAEIAGEANVMMKRLGTITANDGSYTVGNEVLPVASIAGMTAVDVAPNGTDLSTAGNTDGFGNANGRYMGIPGAVFCLGGSDGCSVTDDGKLGAGWYFSPNKPKANYARNPDRTTSEAIPYVEDNLYTSYGLWLSSAGADGYYVNLYATTGDRNAIHVNASSGTHYILGAHDDLAGQATYSGNALGMSVLKTPKAGGGNHLDSGVFTADVSLQATFGASPMLGGIVNNFQGGAVNPSWSVTFNERVFNATTNTQFGVVNIDINTGGNRGKTLASGRDGIWGATAYGGGSATDPQRPAGIFGQFSAHFLDGHVAGAYATRKE